MGSDDPTPLTSSSLLSVLKSTLVVVAGVTGSALLPLLLLAAWGATFDSTGGEPFSRTIFSTLLLWPVFVFLFLYAAAMCCLRTKATVIVRVTDVVLTIYIVVVMTIVRLTSVNY